MLAGPGRATLLSGLLATAVTMPSSRGEIFMSLRTPMPAIRSPPSVQPAPGAVPRESQAAPRGRDPVIHVAHLGLNRLAQGSRRSPLRPNYMYYQGGTLAFGKLTMKNTGMEIVDADPSDPFDFFLDYNEQLVAGYDENLPDHGLLVHMPDHGKLGKPGAIRDKPKVASLSPR